MSKHDDWISMRHMLDHAREAVKIARDKTRSDLYAERILELALTRLVQDVCASSVERQASEERL